MSKRKRFVASEQRRAEVHLELLPFAQRGFAFMEATFPGWQGRIDVDILDMSSGKCCMLAQAGGDNDFTKTANRIDLTEGQAVSFGLLVVGQDQGEVLFKYGVLDTIWSDLLLGIDAPESLYCTAAAEPVTERVLEPA